MKRAFYRQQRVRRGPTRVFCGRYPGFTLIEVMLVVLILGVLLGLVIAMGRHAGDAARRGRATADLGELHRAVDAYFARFEVYPMPSSSDWEAVTGLWERVDVSLENSPRNRLLDYLPHDFSAIDPWGEAYQYQHDPTNSPMTYRLRSRGLNPRKADDPSHIYFEH